MRRGGLLRTTMSTNLPQPPQERRYAPWLTVAILAVMAALLFWYGRSYYLSSIEGRFDHPQYHDLRAAGPIGHGYGIVGTALILTNLLYLVRRLFPRLSLGSLRRWLDIHVIAGLAGALLVVFHSTFELRTRIAATTAGSLGVLVVTGVIGLYIYRLLPKHGLLAFQERLAEVERVVPTFAKRVREAVAEVRVTTLPPNVSILKTLLTVPRWTLEARARRRAVMQAAKKDAVIRQLRKEERALIRDLVHELADLAAAQVDSDAGSALMRSWRSLHGVMAILMVLSVGVHVAVAWFYGYRWILAK